MEKNINKIDNFLALARSLLSFAEYLQKNSKEIKYINLETVYKNFYDKYMKKETDD